MEKYIEISAGRGPQECYLVVKYSLKALRTEAERRNISVEIVKEDKDNGALCSVTLKIKGNEIAHFLSKWLGTIQWICKSPIRPQHKRKNWFIGIFEVQKNEAIKVNEKDIKFETMRSAGPGGQNVNKVNSAVRATYLPTGIAVQVMDSRSQLENKQLAIDRLTSKLKEVQNNRNIKVDFENWTNKLQIERGNPIRTFEGLKFAEK